MFVGNKGLLKYAIEQRFLIIGILVITNKYELIITTITSALPNGNKYEIVPPN